MKRTIGFQKIIGVMLVLIAVAALFSVGASASEYDTKNATMFTFSDSGITASEGAYTSYKIEGTALTIQGSGTYVVSGSAKNGSITVKKGTTDVTLVLNGLTLASEDTAVLSCNKSTGVTIIASKGTVNTLTDSALNNDETHPENENAENAVLKCKDGSNVTLTGEGTLTIVSNGKNAVKSGASTETEGNASLTIENLTLNITANVNDALNAEAELNVLSGTLNITSKDDAIHSDLILNVGKTGTDGPVIQIDKCTEGLEGAVINVYSGDIVLSATDDGVNAANADLGRYSFAINVYGGKMDVTVGQGDTDAFDSNGDIHIYGGTINVTAPTSAFDYDGTATLSEEATVTVNGQRITTITNQMMGGGMFGGRGGQGQMPGFGGKSGQGQMPGFGGRGGQGQNPGFPGQNPGFPGQNGQENVTPPDDGTMPALPDGETPPELPDNGDRPERPENGEQPTITTEPEPSETTNVFVIIGNWFKSIWNAIVSWFTGA